MNSNYIRKIMNEIGCSDGHFLPIADRENQKLLDKINKLQEYRVEKENQLKFIDGRTSKLEAHFKNAECSIDQNTKLIGAQRSDINSETHMQKLYERECSKIQLDSKNLRKTINQCEEYDKQTSKNNMVFMKNIEILTEKIKWAKISLDEWKLAMDEGYQANKMIENYCKDDEQKALDLDIRRRIVVDEINAKRQKLIKIIENRKTLEKSLDRTAELFRQAHIERRNMVETWKDAVKVMNQREHDIRTVEDAIDIAIINKKERFVEFKENENFFKQLIENNKEVELKISIINKDISYTRERYEELLNLISLRDNENQILRKLIQGLINKLQQQRNKNKQISNLKIENETEMTKIIDIITNLRKRHQHFLSKHLSTTARLNMIEEIIDNEENLKDQLTNEITKINGLLFRSQEKLVSLKNEEKLLEADNTGTIASVVFLRRCLLDLKRNIMKFTEEQYDLGMKIELLEIKIAKITGRTADITETLRNEQKLELLEIGAANAIKRKTAIQNQIYKLESDMKNMTILFTEDTNVVEKLDSQVKELTLYIEVGERQIKTKTLGNQDKIVEISILKMRIQEMEMQIAKCQDKVLSMEKFRVEMEKAITERMLQLKVEGEVLQTKRRHLQEERSTYKMDIVERKLKIDSTVKRYILCLDLLGKNNDGTVVSATQLKIESAQERQMLLIEGNEINAKILKTEHEIKQMENTLCLLNFSNNKYRQTFELSENENSELKEFQKQEDDYCTLLYRLKGIKVEIENVSNKIDENVDHRDAVEEQIEEQLRIKADTSETLMKVHKELLEQKTKLKRAEREIRYATRDIRQRSFTNKFLMQFETDLMLKEQLHKNNCALQLFADLIDSNVEISSVVLNLLEEKDLKLPQVQVVKPISATSWRSNYSDITISCSSKAFSPLLSASSRISGGSEESDNLKQPGISRPSIISIDFRPSEILNDSNCFEKSSLKPKVTKSKK